MAGGLPVRRQQGVELSGLHFWQTLQHILEVGTGIVTVTLGTFEDGVDDGAPLARVFASHKHPVLLADRRRPDRVLGEVGVRFDLPVPQEDLQPGPQPERVFDGTTERALWRHGGMTPQLQEIAAERLEDRGTVALSDGGPLFRPGAGLPQLRLGGVEARDGFQGAG